MATAEGAAAAFARIAHEAFDLVLLDLMMPEISGFEALCRLKSEESTRRIPVIMISALDELDSAVRCIEAGAEDYLPKPFNPVLLRARIAACLERKRLLDELRMEQERSEALLLNILPRAVVARMRQGETVIADRIPEATVLFSDLVDFTGLSATLLPEETVKLLGLFRALSANCAFLTTCSTFHSSMGVTAGSGDCCSRGSQGGSWTLGSAPAGISHSIHPTVRSSGSTSVPPCWVERRGDETRRRLALS